jgi:hypothetical protein
MAPIGKTWKWSDEAKKKFSGKVKKMGRVPLLGKGKRYRWKLEKK